MRARLDPTARPRWARTDFAYRGRPSSESRQGFLRLYTGHNAQNPPPSLAFWRFSNAFGGRDRSLIFDRAGLAQKLPFHVRRVDADQPVDDLAVTQRPR